MLLGRSKSPVKRKLGYGLRLPTIEILKHQEIYTMLPTFVSFWLAMEDDKPDKTATWPAESPVSATDISSGNRGDPVFSR